MAELTPEERAAVVAGNYDVATTALLWRIARAAHNFIYSTTLGAEKEARTDLATALNALRAKGWTQAWPEPQKREGGT